MRTGTKPVKKHSLPPSGTEPQNKYARTTSRGERTEECPFLYRRHVSWDYRNPSNRHWFLLPVMAPLGLTKYFIHRGSLEPRGVPHPPPNKIPRTPFLIPFVYRFFPISLPDPTPYYPGIMRNWGGKGGRTRVRGIGYSVRSNPFFSRCPSVTLTRSCIVSLVFCPPFVCQDGSEIGPRRRRSFRVLVFSLKCLSVDVLPFVQ